VRRRLVAVFAAVTAMVAIAFVVPLGVLVRDVARERAIDDATRDASALFPVLAVTDDAQALAVAISRTGSGAVGGRLTVYLPDGTVVGDDAPASDRVDEALAQGRAWTGDVPGGAEVVAPVVRSAGDVAVVRVFVPAGELDEGVRTAWLALAGVGVALVAGSVLLADRLARTVTRPVAELADASHRLGEGDLTARVVPDGPAEVAEVGAAFNTLADRIDGLLHAEREDVADLAHRLRTPLAALRLQLDQVTDPVVRGQLAASADDLARALDRVIEQARRRGRGGGTGADLTAVVAERSAFWGALAEDQGRAASVELPGSPIPVAADPEDLAATLDVLIENVHAHTPDGTAYRITLQRVGGDAVLLVEDAGPGFPGGTVAVRGASTGSTGLGLDIARRTAEEAGGTFAIGASVTGGAAVRLTIPIVG
jgi:signal transduction histidine kinase